MLEFVISVMSLSLVVAVAAIRALLRDWGRHARACDEMRTELDTSAAAAAKALERQNLDRWGHS